MTQLSFVMEHVPSQLLFSPACLSTPPTSPCHHLHTTQHTHNTHTEDDDKDPHLILVCPPRSHTAKGKQTNDGQQRSQLPTKTHFRVAPSVPTFSNHFLYHNPHKTCTEMNSLQTPLNWIGSAQKVMSYRRPLTMAGIFGEMKQTLFTLWQKGTPQFLRLK